MMSRWLRESQLWRLVSLKGRGWETSEMMGMKALWGINGSKHSTGDVGTKKEQ